MKNRGFTATFKISTGICTVTLFISAPRDVFRRRDARPGGRVYAGAGNLVETHKDKGECLALRCLFALFLAMPLSRSPHTLRVRAR
ncbi:MAG: hypothetical protein DMF00_11435 [Verrucomicrobia bacterium]|nr:MAG: hypothetical protein DMF00_11435 [Verrucomicrobiota bacterium]